MAQDTPNIRQTISAPAPVPSGTDLRLLRSWLDQLRQTVGQCVQVVNSMRIPYTARPVLSAGGAGDPVPEDPASYNTIGDATEGSEAANTGTHTYDGDKGLRLYAMTRVAYYHAGDQKLYGYARLLKFDKYGRLYSVGAETRIEIDVPEI